MTLEERIKNWWPEGTTQDILLDMVHRINVLTRIETLWADMDNAVNERCGSEEYEALEDEMDALREGLREGDKGFVPKADLDAANERVAEVRRYNLGLANESQEYQERLRVAKKRIKELCEEQRKTASFWERIRIKAATESNARIHELEAQLAERVAEVRRYNLGPGNESQEYQERLGVAKKLVREARDRRIEDAYCQEQKRLKWARELGEANRCIRRLEDRLAERDADAEVGKAIRELRPDRDGVTISFWLRWEQADDPPKYAGVEYDYHGCRCGTSGCASLLTAIRAYNERKG
jgi:hypothetical protein